MYGVAYSEASDDLHNCVMLLPYFVIIMYWFLELFIINLLFINNVMQTYADIVYITFKNPILFPNSVKPVHTLQAWWHHL